MQLIISGTSKSLKSLEINNEISDFEMIFFKLQTLHCQHLDQIFTNCKCSNSQDCLRYVTKLCLRYVTKLTIHISYFDFSVPVISQIKFIECGQTDGGRVGELKVG